jgi:hypothetical protein
MVTVSIVFAAYSLCQPEMDRDVRHRRLRGTRQEQQRIVENKEARGYEGCKAVGVGISHEFNV